MINYYKKDNKLILSYYPEQGQEDWIVKALQERGKASIKKTFTFKPTDIFQWPSINDEDENFSFDKYDTQFVIGELEGSYYKIRKGILLSDYDIYLDRNLQITKEIFVADHDISVFGSLASLIREDIYIGGEHDKAIPEKAFNRILSNFPNTYEKKLYAKARITAILRDYLDTTIDGEMQYQQYMNKKIPLKGSNLQKLFKEWELEKYTTILQRLEQMLHNEKVYSEKNWQEELIQILLLLYPKYIAVFREVPIELPGSGRRYLDYLLLDSNGHADIVKSYHADHRSCDADHLG
ncbi:MAG TPA: hypothetical protein VGM30_17060 [Puia sp.]|jgi:hypothetical protein